MTRSWNYFPRSSTISTRTRGSAAGIQPSTSSLPHCPRSPETSAVFKQRHFNVIPPTHENIHSRRVALSCCQCDVTQHSALCGSGALRHLPFACAFSDVLFLGVESLKNTTSSRMFLFASVDKVLHQRALCLLNLILFG